MNFSKINSDSQLHPKLSLDVFKDKMVQNVHQMKGGESANCNVTIQVVVSDDSDHTLDKCHD